jgi:hypothetical protein
LGQKGGEQDAGGEQGVLAGADVDVGDAGRVYHVVDIETTRFWGFWGILGGWDAFRGVLMFPIVCSVISELWLVVLGGAECEVRLLLTNTLLMMWQAAWTRKTSWWARGG